MTRDANGTAAPGLLPLLQLSDSAFPTGSFSHSAGLEGLVEIGRLHDAVTLQAAAEEHLGLLATADLPVLRGAARAGSLSELVTLDQTLAATRPTREQRAASAATGRALLDSAHALGLDDEQLSGYRAAAVRRDTPGSQAVAAGVVASALGVGVPEALTGFAYAACAALVAAGQKLLLLGQRAVQRVLFALHPNITAAVAASRTHDPADPFAFAPVLEVASMTHERQPTRLYIS
jgi:urease accessory protein